MLILNYRHLAIAGSLLLINMLQGCASPGIEITELQAVETRSSIQLREPYVLPINNTTKSRFFLAPGKYTAERMGKIGTFFRGPNNCLAIIGEFQTIYGKDKTHLYLRDGGILIPSATPSLPKIYFYKAAVSPILLDGLIEPGKFPQDYAATGVDTEAFAKFGPVVLGVISAGDGNIIVPENQPVNDSLAKLISFDSDVSQPPIDQRSGH